MDEEKQMVLAGLMVQLFRGRQDVIGVGHRDGTFRPVKLPSPLQPEWLVETHLAGEKAVGIYPVQPDSTVWWAAADLDDHDNNPNPSWFDDATDLCLAASQYGLHPLLNVSQSGRGAHVLVFFDEPVQAAVAQQLMAALGEAAEVRLHEIYPKQQRYQDGKVGNLLRLPLWNKSKLLDWETGAEMDPVEALGECLWKRSNEAEAVGVVRAITGSLPEPEPELEEVADGISVELPKRVTELLRLKDSTLSKRWGGVTDGTDGSMSGVMQSIANELVRAYVPTHEICAALLVWCKHRGYEEKGGRILDRTVEKAYQWISEDGPQGSRQSTDFTGAVLQFLEDRRTGKHELIPFGIVELDASIDGIGPGQLCIVAGRPSHGKTLLGMQWLDQAARMGHRTLFISEEMNVSEIGQRVAAWAEGVTDDEITRGIRQRYARCPAPQLVTYLGDLDAVERCIEQHHIRHGVDCVVVDYLQLLGGASGRYEIVSEISRRLKRLAGRLGLHMMVLCQTNREIERRDNKIPQNSDLRESGQIEQDADLIIFGVWPHRFEGTTTDPDEYWFVCTKRRNGPIRQSLVQSRIWPERSRLGIGAFLC